MSKIEEKIEKKLAVADILKSSIFFFFSKTKFRVTFLMLLDVKYYKKNNMKGFEKKIN